MDQVHVKYLTEHETSKVRTPSQRFFLPAKFVQSININIYYNAASHVDELFNDLDMHTIHVFNIILEHSRTPRLPTKLFVVIVNRFLPRMRW